jgi:hypothetical protein
MAKKRLRATGDPTTWKLLSELGTKPAQDPTDDGVNECENCPSIFDPSQSPIVAAAARCGDRELLALLVELTRHPAPSFRKYIANIVRGKEPRAAKPTKIVNFYHLDIAYFVHRQCDNGMSRDDAIAKAEKHFKTSTSTVERALRHFRKKGPK